MSHHQSYIGVICGSETEICDIMKGEPVEAFSVVLCLAPNPCFPKGQVTEHFSEPVLNPEIKIINFTSI